MTTLAEKPTIFKEENKTEINFQDLKEEVKSLLFHSPFDWRENTSLAKDLNESLEVTDKILASLFEEGFIRNPIFAKGEELNYWRFSTRPLTKQEYMRKFFKFFKRN